MLLALALLFAPVDVKPARNVTAGRVQPTQHVTGTGLGCRFWAWSPSLGFPLALRLREMMRVKGEDAVPARVARLSSGVYPGTGKEL